MNETQIKMKQTRNNYINAISLEIDLFLVFIAILIL